MLLQGQTVVIVGASSGIGLATARAASAAGAQAIMMSRSVERLETAARSIGGSPQTVSVDMLDTGQVATAFGLITHLDHLVLTAVADENARRGRLVALTDDQFERSIDKLRGFFNITRAAAPKLADRGSITLLSGDSAFKPPRQGMSVLAAVNAAVASFGHALALELAPTRVNVISPGVVDTAVWTADQRAQLQAWAESPALPAQHLGQPEDIAHAVMFLMTNPYVTGHTLFVDGGLVAT